MPPTIRIMLVDDHAVVRAGYRVLLSQADNLVVVAEAESGEQACQYYVDHQPDVVVMDLSLPGIGGLAAIHRICARDETARILVFSMHDEAAYVERALAAGAQGYITKASAPDILLEAVRSIAGGGVYVESRLAECLAARSRCGAEENPGMAQLSAREFDVFCLLAQGCTTRQVAEMLCMGYKTAANHATAIRAKLGVNTTAEMARLAYQQGLIKH
ncbi:MAG: response regulator transcription factor [Methylococcaceae bacterium]|nr:MAG: response regulator transcription factor [Methylococcaceae bacterium]